MTREEFIQQYIHFSDPLSSAPDIDRERRKLYSDMIAQIIGESLFLFEDFYYAADIKMVEEDMRSIHYCIDLMPAVNAYVDIYHNRIILYLFTITATNHMTIMTELLDLLTREEHATNEEILRKALEWADADDNIGRIERYIEYYSIRKPLLIEGEQGKTYLKWLDGIFQRQKYSFYTYDILKLIFLHELGHWQYARFTDHMRCEYSKPVNTFFQKHFTEEYLLSNRQMLDAWAEEIIADYIALLVFTKNHRQNGEDKQCTKACYIAIGLYYGLIAMEELGSGQYGKTAGTHPPAKLRQETAQELYANFFSEILGIPYDTFIGEEIQEWYVIQLYFSKIIEEYRRRKHE